MRTRIFSIFIVLVAIVAFASAASACEKCVSAGYNGWSKCESGYASGSSYCYGGFGTSCTTGGSCGGSGGGGGGFNDGPFYPDYNFSTGSTEEAPGQGFALRRAPEAAPAAPRPVIVSATTVE